MPAGRADMYEQFYGLRERPFSLLPDADFLYLSEQHQAALDMLELSLTDFSGYCVVSGEIGTGKTTLIRALLTRLPNTISAGLVSNTHHSFGDLMQWVLGSFGLKSTTESVEERCNQFFQFVIDEYAKGKSTLLIIDEAQNLSQEAMQQLSSLSQVNREGDKVLQIILVGQAELKEKLQNPELDSLAQQVSLFYHLTELSELDTGKYIQHRVNHSGGSSDLFSDSICQMVYQATHGVPRLVNRLCDLALICSYSKDSSVVELDMMSEAAEELGHSAALAMGQVQASVDLNLSVAVGQEFTVSSVRRKTMSEEQLEKLVNPERTEKKLAEVIDHPARHAEIAEKTVDSKISETNLDQTGREWSVFWRLLAASAIGWVVILAIW